MAEVASRIDKLVALLFVVALGLVCVGMLSWLMDKDRAWEKRKKESCIERGGKVIENVGGFLRFQCDGPTRFN